MIQKLWYQISSGWNLRRFFYTGIGMLLIAQSYLDGPWFGYFIGGYFASMGLFGFGCAGGHCFSPTEKNLNPNLTGNQDTKILSNNSHSTPDNNQ